MLPKRLGTAKFSGKSEGYVFIPTIVDRNTKKTHPAGFEIPHKKLANTAILQTRMSPLCSDLCLVNDILFLAVHVRGARA